MDVQMTTHDDCVLMSWSGDESCMPACTSWKQSVQYIDERPVAKVISRTVCSALIDSL